ncbi:MAG: CoA pyrophosphatase [Chitinophagales bacterium]|nr:CoA pyrophosphatase [Chitinophagales bacterium]
MFDNFIVALEKQLKEPLPGREAQKLMQPYLPLLSKFDLRMPKNNAKESAVMALIYPKRDQPHIVLIERAIYKGVHSGQISLPGGKLEADETPLVCAIRETCEEVGVQKNDYHVIGNLTKTYIPPSNFNVQPFVAVADKPFDLEKDQREVSTILETPLSYLFDKDRRKEKWMKSAVGLKVKAPYFDIYDRTLWGATAMILSELIEVVSLAPQEYLKR